jgi:nitroreductase
VLAASAVNEQLWAFTVVRDQALLERISRAAKSYMLGNIPPGAHADRFKTMLSDPNFHIFYHAPVLILIAATSPGPWIVEELRAGGREPHAGRLRGRAGFVLDRLRSRLSQHAGRQVDGGAS